jgi:hypothetical protein
LTHSVVSLEHWPFWPTSLLRLEMQHFRSD